MKYELSELDVVWRKGNGEMPDNVKHVVNAAREERFLRSMQLPDDVTNAIRENARESNQTITEYISSLVLTGMQPA